MLCFIRDRSQFWLKIFDEGNINISANSMTKSLLEQAFPNLAKYSPHGWIESKKYSDIFNLWIPNNQIECCSSELETVKAWATQANQHIWLGLNNHIKDSFSGKEVDYCIAADWNMDFETKRRTDIGKAEYQLKYKFPKRCLDKDDIDRFANVLSSAVLHCVNCLPFELKNFIVTAIPATKEKQDKLAWRLAKFTAQKMQARFMEAALMCDKPQMKELSVNDKLCIWRKIFASNMLELSLDVKGNNVLIVDDLYQSGASIWCFADFLKKVCGAKMVMAITMVKSQRDGDNL